MAFAHSASLGAAAAAASRISGVASPTPGSPLRRMSPEGSKTPESASGCRSPGSPIGEESCPICLGSFTDKCAAGSCLHNFCLVCLKEWSKQRPVCPLCKQSFTKILYDIKSETDYKEWKVPILYPNDLNDLEFRGFRQFFDTYGRRFFGYRSTFPRFIRRRTPASSLRSSSVLGEANRQQRNFDRGSSLFRLSVYSNNLWVLPLPDITGRYRESSPQLYREQPALTHRLVPWVNRELAALISSSRIGVVLSLIMDLIESHPIDSTEFRRAIRPHLGVWTSHFAHEFYNFARSPYDLVGHDNAAQYLPSYDRVREGAYDEFVEDDDIIEVEPEPLDLSSRVAREETIGNDGSVFISSDSDSSLIEQTNNNDLEAIFTERSSVLPFLHRENRNSSQETHIPNYDRIPLPNELGEPGPSGVSSSNSSSIKRERSCPENSSDSDDCLIVDVLKPKKERTPELIQLSSGAELEEQEREARDKNSSKIHWKKRNIESRNISKHNHKRPRLDRTSFSLHVIGTLNCQRGEDHTYCTESTSPCNRSSTRTESEEDDLENDPDYESKRSARDQVGRFRWNRVDSDSDSNIEMTVTSRFKEGSASSKQRHQRRFCNKTGSHGHSSSAQKSRKDQKHKVKSSARASSSAGIPEASSSSHHPSSKRKRDSPPKSWKELNCTRKRTSHYSSSSSSSASSSSFSSCSSSSSSSSSSSDSSFSCTSSSSSNSSSKRTKKPSSLKRRPRYEERNSFSGDYSDSSFSSDSEEDRRTSRTKSRGNSSKKCLQTQRSRSLLGKKCKKGKTQIKSSSKARGKQSSKNHKK